MLKQHLRHNRLFRSIFAVPLAVRRRIRGFRQAQTAEHYSKTVRGGYLLLQPRNIGARFRVSALSDLAKRIVTTGAFEPELTNILERVRHIGGDIINIGANVGFYAVFFAHHFSNARTIYAIEPNPEAFADLERNILENGCVDRIKAIQMCVGDVEGEQTLSIVPGMSEYSSIGQIVHSAVDRIQQRTVSVRVKPLEQAIGNPCLNPTLLFMDVEGAELLAVRGAERLLRENQPLIFFECDDQLLRKFGHSSSMLEEHLRALGYLVRDALDARVPLQHPFTGDAVAVPSTKVEWIAMLSRA
jgi:FkbM family methyltransferase